MSQSETDQPKRLSVGPFNRVEGDLDIKLEIAAGAVTSARVNSTLYRGFEQILIGKPAMDALVYTPRICGICSVSQSVACARALADASGVAMSPNGALSQNLLLANESLTDLLTHFYLFFMPDFARTVYQRESWFEPVERRFKAVKGQATREVLPARAGFLHLMGLMAGHWPHTLAIQPGGTSKPVTKQEKIRLLAILAEFRRFLEHVLFDDDLEVISALSTLEQLWAWQHQKDWQQGDLRRFLHLSDALGLDQLGQATDRYLSVGNFPLKEDARLLPAGVWTPQGTQPFDVSLITEDISFSWMDGVDNQPLHPQQGQTEVSLRSSEKPEAYSWCKAPRLAGSVVETGALARALVGGNPLLAELVTQYGGSVTARVLGRLLELASLVPQMQLWAKSLQPDQPFCDHLDLHSQLDGEGVGLIEAARGSLGHWVRIKNGKISHYQIVAPTTWNFSPRDQHGVPGALEQALEGAPVQEGEKDPVAVQHIVRSFDPCMVCTVH